MGLGSVASAGTRRWPLALWCAWLAVLVASPEYDRALIAESSHAFAALGLLAGTACSLALPSGAAPGDAESAAEAPLSGLLRRARPVALGAIVSLGAIASVASLALNLVNWVVTGLLGIWVLDSPVPVALIDIWTGARPWAPALSALSGLSCALACVPCLRAARGAGPEARSVPLAPLSLALVTLLLAGALRPCVWFGVCWVGIGPASEVVALPFRLVWGALVALCVCRLLRRLGLRVAPAPRLEVDEGALLALLVAALALGTLAQRWLGYVVGVTPYVLFDLADLVGLAWDPAPLVLVASASLGALVAAALVALPVVAGRWARSLGVAAAPSGTAGRPGDEGEEGEKDAGSARDPLRELVARGLTEREAQAVRALLDGLSSREAAERLGLGASTVRNYQQRAYRKLGVACAGEARELLAGEAPGPGAPGPTAEGEGAPVGPAPEGVARRVAGVLLACFLLLPLGSGGRLAWWVSGQVATCAAGGLALAAALLALDALRARGVLVDGREAARPPARGERAALLASGSVVVACRLALLLGGPWVSVLAFRAAMALAVPAFVALSLRRAARAAGSRPGALPLVAHAVLGDPWALAVACLSASLLGAVWEELWRAAVWTDFSLFPQALPFLAAVLGACAALVWLRPGRGSRALSGAALALSLVTLAIEGWETAVLLCALLHGTILARGLSRERGGAAARPGDAAAVAALACASCAAGACAGVVVVNRYAAMFTTETNLLLVGAYDYERLVAFTSSASYVMGALFLALGCALVVATWRVVCSVDAERLMEGVRVTPEQRLRAFLVSRGLSDLQAEVTLLTAEGLSARQIGARLHYAPGTVSAARVGAYRALGVHDRAQLVAVLSGAGG